MPEATPKQRKYPDSVQPGIPRLRPLKAGWQRKEIGELLLQVNRPVTMNNQESYNLVTVKRSRGGVVKRDTKKGREIAVKSQFVVQAGDFLISKRQIVHGACGMVPDGLDGSIVSNEYSVLNCTDLLDSGFLNYLTYTTYFQQTCFHSSIGVHIEKMIFKLEDWFKWKIDIPTLPEQQKIAAFLGAVDQKLVALRRKRELLQNYKRGMLQKIFSQELRFKADDGTEFPEWEKKTFGEMFNFVRTNNLSRDQLTNEPQQVQNIHYGDIHSKYKAQFYQNNELVPFVKNRFKWDVSEEEYCRSGDLIIADASEDYTDIGKTIEVIKVEERTLVAGLHTYIARPRSNDFISGFAGYIMQTRGMRRQVMKIAQGISVLGISKSNLSKLTLWKPHHDEQQKIADFLSAIDAKIDAVTGQIAKMEQFKKGLLQQMFC